MTEQTAIVTRNNGNLAFVSSGPEALAKRLENMIANGKKLEPIERLALAQYAVATGLNPFVGECYFLPGVGPGPGIAGWRVKAEEQLEYEANKARIAYARFYCEYREPDESEARWNPDKGDIAVKAILHDTLTKTEWEKRILSYYIELIKNGIKDGAWDTAREIAGAEPTWSAVGVVRGGESFAGEGKPEKMDRYERACKRAEKAVIRKRFPRVSLPEPVGFDESEIVDVRVMDVTHRTEAQIVGELYAESTPLVSVQQPEPVSEKTAEPSSSDNPFAAFDLQANAAPDQAFWSLQRHIKYNQNDAKELLKAVDGDFKQAYDRLRKLAETIPAVA